MNAMQLALSVLQAVKVKYVKAEKTEIHTSATVDDAMVWAEYEFKNLRDRPRNNSLRFCI